MCQDLISTESQEFIAVTRLTALRMERISALSVFD